MTPAWRTSRIGEIGGSFLLVCRRVIAHWRPIILLLILALATFLIAHADFFGLFLFALLLIFIASQIFWISRILDLGEGFIPDKPRRLWLAIIAGLVYLFVFTYSYPELGLGHTIRAADYRRHSMLIHAVFWWWLVGSLLAFLLVIFLGRQIGWPAPLGGFTAKRARLCTSPRLLMPELPCFRPAAVAFWSGPRC